MFVKLTGHKTNQPIFSLISRILAIGGVTTDANIFIRTEILIEGYDDKINVRETPEQIMEMMEKVSSDDYNDKISA